MRLVIVSNRLPFSVSRKDNGFAFKKSDGGLASGISSYIEFLKNNNKKFEYLWIGWPGISMQEDEKRQVEEAATDLCATKLVTIPDAVAHDFYNGFCNKTLWPLFHYFPHYVSYQDRWWSAYKTVNELFARTIEGQLQKDDIVFIQDYHLMLLPRLLRRQFLNLQMGFFLHIPFPQFELFRELPTEWRSELLQGMLGADTIGFHTSEYAQYFFEAVQKTLYYPAFNNMIATPEKVVYADAFPMGIDYGKFFNALAENSEIAQEVRAIKEHYGHKKIILSVERLDYTKGVPNRLLGFAQFLKTNRMWHEKVQFVLVAAPSRTDIDSYMDQKKEIDELVGRINGEYGTLKWTPIVYQYKSVDFSHLVSLYQVADIMVVTPMRDGMNLVAKEYIASRIHHNGVLILSEFAGVSSELSGALMVNPNRHLEIADALEKGLRMSEQEQMERMLPMQKIVQKNNIYRWVDDIMHAIHNKTKKRFGPENARGKEFLTMA